METNPPQGNPIVDAADVPPASESDREPVAEASAAADEIAVVEAEATDDAEELPEADDDTPPFLEFLDDWEKKTQPDK